MTKSETRKTITKRILIGIGIALVLAYIVFLFVTTNFLGSNNISTEITYRSTAEDIVKTTGLVVRDEEYVNANAEYDGSLFFRYGHVKADPGGATAAMVPMLTE